jgi:hypothetical protein
MEVRQLVREPTRELLILCGPAVGAFRDHSVSAASVARLKSQASLGIRSHRPMRPFVRASLFLVSLVSEAHAQRPGSHPDPAQIPVVAYEGHCANLDAVRAVIRTLADFRRFCADGDSSSLSGSGSIDFDKEMIIVASLGDQPAGGRGIKIVNVRAHQGVLDVSIRVSVAGPHCVVTLMVEHPRDVVRVPATPSTPVFHDQLTVVPCKHP